MPTVLVSKEEDVHSNMLGERELHRIQRELNSTSVVTEKSSRTRGGNTEIVKKPPQPDNLLSSRGHGTELSLSAGAGDTGLFLGLPGEQGRAQKQTEASDRAAIRGITGPCSIRVSGELERAAAGEEQATARSRAKIAQNSEQMSIVD